MMDKRWKILSAESNTANQLSRELNIPLYIAQILINRGIKELEQARRFLSRQDADEVSPWLMKGMTETVARIKRAIDEQEHIVIYGDYDVDGVTATSVMMRVLMTLGANVSYFIPNRHTDGYGLNCDSLDELVALRQARLIITVDCGITSAEEADALDERVDLIITDHHQPPAILPKAYAIVNPKQEDCRYPEKMLAGVGVAYKVCQALWQEMRGERLTEHLELVALGTIADIVPLIGENRTFVQLGLTAMRSGASCGINALMKVSQVEAAQVNAGQIGYRLAPRLNAAGRLDSARRCVELLLCTDQAQCDMIAEELNRENEQRQQIEKKISEEAIQAIEKNGYQDDRIIVVAGEGWHGGVIGIVASRIVEKYYRPTIVISLEDGVGRGSCRSIEGIDIHDALSSVQDLLVKFGGHKQAAGLTIASDKIDELRARLGLYAAKYEKEDIWRPQVKIDTVIAPTKINERLIESLAVLEPFGMGNPRPLFACERMPIRTIRRIGKDKQTIKMGLECLGEELECIAWRNPDWADRYYPSDLVDVAFQPDINEWNGRRTVQLVVSDIRTSDEIDARFQTLYEEKHDHGTSIADADMFYSKLVGVTFDERQAVIPTLHEGDTLMLLREATNPYDKNAIRVLTKDGRDVGFIRKEIASEIAPRIDEGEKYRCLVTAVTGGGEHSFGVNILMEKDVREEKRAAVGALVRDDEAIRQAILGDYDYHDSQKRILTELDQGKNILAIMGTGRGKSAIFQSHAAKIAVMRREMTVILYPLRALVNDQYSSLQKKMAALGLCVYKGNGTISTQERQELANALQEGSVDILLTTPEFLEANREHLSAQKRKIGFLVVDEGHHIAISAARRPIYRRLDQISRGIGSPQVLVVTATASDETAEVIRESLAIDTTFVDKTVRSNLSLVDWRDTSNKSQRLIEVVETGEKTLIFVNSRKQAFDIASALRRKMPWLDDKIGFYHAGMKNEWRVLVENWFKEGKLRAVVATSAFGEGVDLPDIRHVVQYHLPFHFTAFNQQCGRGGRDGKNSRIYLMFGGDDKRLNTQILQDRAPQRETLGEVYRILRKRAVDSRLSLSNAELAEELETATHRYSSEAGIQIALKIFEELSLIKRHTRGNKREIEMLPMPKCKRELTESTTYCEGLAEQDEFGGFSETVLTESAENLLSRINQPIYPKNQSIITLI